MESETDESLRLSQLARLLARARDQGVRGLSTQELRDLPRLYRHASSLVARLEASGHDPATEERARALLVRAHGLLYREPRRGPAELLRSAARFLLVESPRAIRAERRLLGAIFLLFYGLSAAAFFAVRADLELAFSLFDPQTVETEIEQLRATEEGEPFRGNFTFGFESSAGTSGWIIGHNVLVATLFFSAGLLPPVFLLILVGNALMLGTYTGVAGHWDQAVEISSILWCHGTIEIQMIVLAGAAGLVLVRGVIAPGPWSRRRAMAFEGRRAWCLMAPVAPFLFVSGLIEGYVSPHAPTPVRLVVALLSAVLLMLWVGFGGRRGETGPVPAD